MPGHGGFGPGFASVGTYAANNFKTFAFTGNGAARSFTTPGFQPDLVAIFNNGTPAGTAQYPVFDSSLGVQHGYDWGSGSSSAPYTDAQSLTAFNTTGFSLGTGGTIASCNTNLQTYQANCWKKFAGFFDIQTWTGNGTSQNISHALGVAPNLILVTPSVSSATLELVWSMYDSSTVTPGARVNRWNPGTTVTTSVNTTVWNNTAATSSVFSVGADNLSNQSAKTYVAYLFAAKAGLSAAGTYTGNGSTSGPSVSLGFRPSLVLIFAQALVAQNIWFVYGNNLNTEINQNVVQNTSNFLNLTATGFTVATANADFNTNLSTYVYMAWK